MPVRKLGNLGNIKEISIRKKGDNARGYHILGRALSAGGIW